jgi:hypothetical protein
MNLLDDTTDAQARALWEFSGFAASRGPYPGRRAALARMVRPVTRTARTALAAWLRPLLVLLAPALTAAAPVRRGAGRTRRHQRDRSVCAPVRGSPRTPPYPTARGPTAG